MNNVRERRFDAIAPEVVALSADVTPPGGHITQIGPEDV
jgi:hypothetical protein